MIGLCTHLVEAVRSHICDADGVPPASALTRRCPAIVPPLSYRSLAVPSALSCRCCPAAVPPPSGRCRPAAVPPGSAPFRRNAARVPPRCPAAVPSASPSHVLLPSHSCPASVCTVVGDVPPLSCPRPPVPPTAAVLASRRCLTAVRFLSRQRLRRPENDGAGGNDRKKDGA